MIGAGVKYFVFLFLLFFGCCFVFSEDEVLGSLIQSEMGTQ